MYYNDIKISIVKVKSSNVQGIGYHDKYQILAIQMNNGKLFYYLDIPKKHYEGLLRCNQGNIDEIKSIGSYLHRNIKGYYRYTLIKKYYGKEK